MAVSSWFYKLHALLRLSKEELSLSMEGSSQLQNQIRISKMRTSKSFLLVEKKKRENWVEKEGKLFFICSKTKRMSSKQLRIKHEERHVKRLTPKRGRLG